MTSQQWRDNASSNTHSDTLAVIARLREEYREIVEARVPIAHILIFGAIGFVLAYAAAVIG